METHVVMLGSPHWKESLQPMFCFHGLLVLWGQELLINHQPGEALTLFWSGYPGWFHSPCILENHVCCPECVRHQDTDLNPSIDCMWVYWLWVCRRGNRPHQRFPRRQTHAQAGRLRPPHPEAVDATVWRSGVWCEMFVRHTMVFCLLGDFSTRWKSWESV